MNIRKHFVLENSPKAFDDFKNKQKKCIKEINRFRKEINRFSSKGMFNIYLKVTIKKKWRT